MRKNNPLLQKAAPIGSVISPRLPQVGLIRTYNTLQPVSVGFL